MNGNKDKTQTSQGDFERAVFEAMRRGGWILPQTAEEVRRAEEELAANPVELPSGLADPYAVLDQPHRRIRLGGKLEVGRDSILENLAQAAREGEGIPLEVKEQMRKDREAAENEKGG
ncbi:hypothetical protein ES703_21628 [subsurface metagenome]